MIKKFFKKFLGNNEHSEKQPKRKTKSTYKKNSSNQHPTRTQKDIATKLKEPWVDVISFKINQDNIRNGFYELDWNDYFIIELKKEGYGYDGDPDEEIVGRWFRDICINAAAMEGVDMDERSAGYINVAKLTGGKMEIR